MVHLNGRNSIGAPSPKTLGVHSGNREGFFGRVPLHIRFILNLAILRVGDLFGMVTVTLRDPFLNGYISDLEGLGDF